MLHVASFSGNVGDNASHQGLGTILDQLLGTYTLKKLEIRDFYKNAQASYKRSFDQSFVDQCNSVDLVIFGGGGYLDYWIPGSSTGTTFDITLQNLERVKTPFLLASIGCVPAKPAPEGNTEKFGAFLGAISELDNFQLLFRNDGSLDHVQDKFEQSLARSFHEILDNAFHYDPEPSFFIPSSKPYIAVNIANDQIRMKGEYAVRIDPGEYFENLAATVDRLVGLGEYHVCFVPHIPVDLEAIKSVLDLLPEKVTRENILVSPYLMGNVGADATFNVYRNSELVIGNRFHTNVCSLSMGKRVIGIAALERVEKMFDSLGLEGNYLKPIGHFQDQLFERAVSALGSSSEKDLKETEKRILVARKKSVDAYQRCLVQLGVLGR